jgi:hypothetical protein
MRNTTQNKISSNLLFFINPDRTAKTIAVTPLYYSRINDCRTEMGTEIGKKVIENLKKMVLEN